MTATNEEPKKPTGAESEANPANTPANTTEQPEEWVRKKVVPPSPNDPDKSDDDDRSPGGSGRGLGQVITTSQPAEQPDSIE